MFNSKFHQVNLILLVYYFQYLDDELCSDNYSLSLKPVTVVVLYVIVVVLSLNFWMNSYFKFTVRQNLWLLYFSFANTADEISQ